MKEQQKQKLSRFANGYRITWLVPVEAVAYGSIITLGLKYGFGLAIPLVLVPFFVVLKKVASMEQKPAKTRVAKQKKTGSRPAFEQITIPSEIRTKKPTFQSV
jgi:hypothetical protein